MSKLIAEKTQVARKDYECMASIWITEGDLDWMVENTSFTEKRYLVKARRNGWRVKKGERYLRQYCEHEGNTYTFIAIPEMHALCMKYQYYVE